MRSIGVIAGAFFLLGFTVEEREREKKEKKNWGSITDGFFFSFFFLWFIDFDRV